MEIDSPDFNKKEFTPEEINQYQTKVMQFLEKEKEVDNIKNLITRKVDETNWVKQVRDLGTQRINDETIEELTPETLTAMILDQAIDVLPSDLQSMVEKYIVEFLTKKKITPDQATNSK